MLPARMRSRHSPVNCRQRDRTQASVTRRGPGRAVGALWLLGAVGFATVSVSTRWGAGLSPDSLVYVDAGRNLLRGSGIAATRADGSLHPLTHYPPLYPVVLAAAGRLVGDPAAGARWVGAIVFAANIVLVGRMVADFSSSSAALSAAALTLLSPDLLEVHSMAWSEGPFILLSTLGLFLLARYAGGGSAVLLGGSAVMAALAVMTRYAGTALVATGVTTVVCLGRGVRARRVVDALLYAVIACTPVAAWTVRNLRLAHTAVNRTATLHPIGLVQLGDAVTVVSGWVLPRAPAAIRIGALVAVLGILVVASARGAGERAAAARERGALSWILVVYCASYILMLLMTISMLDANTPMDARILSPLYVVALMVVLPATGRLAARSVRGSLAPVLLLPVLLAHAIAAVAFVSRAYSAGQGYVGRSWRESPTIRRIGALPERTPIFSNRYDAIRLLTGRPAGRVPLTWDPGTRRANPRLVDEMARLQRELEERGGVVVYFTRMGGRAEYMIAEEELARELPLERVSRERDGAIYRWKGAGATERPVERLAGASASGLYTSPVFENEEAMLKGDEEAGHACAWKGRRKKLGIVICKQAMELRCGVRGWYGIGPC